MRNKISLAGDLGSGKSTVSAILVDLLSCEYYSTGAIVRQIAEKHGMSVIELNKYMETHPEIDHEIDDGLKNLSYDERRLIIDSRMAWHFTEGTFKIYFSTDIETSAFRIMNANRRGEHAASLEDTIRDTRARRESEKKRYLEQYGVDIKDLSNYALIIDTTYASPAEIAQCVKAEYEEWLNNEAHKKLLLSPFRIQYPDDAPDDRLVSILYSKLEGGEDIPSPEIVEADGDFYLVGNHESAIAYTLTDTLFIPCRLVDGVPSGNYIRMSNTL